MAMVKGSNRGTFELELATLPSTHPGKMSHGGLTHKRCIFEPFDVFYVPFFSWTMTSKCTAQASGCTIQHSSARNHLHLLVGPLEPAISLGAPKNIPRPCLTGQNKNECVGGCKAVTTIFQKRLFLMQFATQPHRAKHE